ncbi:MAG: hypothetical protein P4L90_25955 [Rhodopila sp.]|nr:hypothetical protein [Rhodopila sp.]
MEAIGEILRRVFMEMAKVLAATSDRLMTDAVRQDGIRDESTEKDEPISGGLAPKFIESSDLVKLPMAFPVMDLAEPHHFERLGIVVVVRLGLCATTADTWLTFDLASLQCVFDGLMGLPLFRVGSLPLGIFRGAVARVIGPEAPQTQPRVFTRFCHHSHQTAPMTAL